MVFVIIEKKTQKSKTNADFSNSRILKSSEFGFITCLKEPATIIYRKQISKKLYDNNTVIVSLLWKAFNIDMCQSILFNKKPILFVKPFLRMVQRMVNLHKMFV